MGFSGPGRQRHGPALGLLSFAGFWVERTPVHEAAQRGETLQLQRLIESGACVNQVTVDSITPLHAASLQGQAQCVQLLLAAGAQVSGPAGRTPETGRDGTCSRERREGGEGNTRPRISVMGKSMESRETPGGEGGSPSGLQWTPTREPPLSQLHAEDQRGHGSALRRALGAREKAVVGRERQGECSAGGRSRPAHRRAEELLLESRTRILVSEMTEWDAGKAALAGRWRWGWHRTQDSGWFSLV